MTHVRRVQGGRAAGLVFLFLACLALVLTLVPGGTGPQASARLSAAELYRPVSPPHASAGFQPAGALVAARRNHTATRLANGKIFIAGGFDAGGNRLSSAELYNPASGQRRAVPASMTTPRANHTATLLPNGYVLVNGGDAAGNTAEVFDPRHNTFTRTAGNMAFGRYYHTATLLRTGKVLVAGGSSATVAELYDPSSGLFTRTAGSPLFGDGFYSTATLLPNGKVLIVGYGNPYTQLYDPATDSFASGAFMSNAYSGHTATLLPTGKVLIAGFGMSAPAQLYDPASGFSVTGTMNQRRCYHTATVLPDGKVLIAGGSAAAGGGSPIVSSAELYDPQTGSFTSIAAMSGAREYHTATLLGPSGKVFIAGGSDGSVTLATTELYRPR